MNRFRPFFAVLFAWLLAFQAVAGVSGMACRHAGSGGAVENGMPAMDHAAMGHAEHQQHMQQMADAAAADAHSLHQGGAPGACDCGCDCANDCAMSSCAGLASTLRQEWPLTYPSFISSPASVVTTAAHGLDLFRPPSIS